MTYRPYAGSPVDPFVDHRSFRDPQRMFFKAAWAAADEAGIVHLGDRLDFVWEALTGEYDITPKKGDTKRFAPARGSSGAER